jgi:signal transduction histidine kinase
VSIQNDRNYKSAQIISIVLGICLVINFGCDFWAFRSYKQTDVSGSDVLRASSVELHLQKLDRAIEAMHLKHFGNISPRAQEQLQEATAETNELKTLLSDHTDQRDILEVISGVLRTHPFDDIVTIDELVHKLVLNQSEILEKAVNVDRVRNKQLDQRLSAAIVFDLLLIVIAGALYYFERRIRQRIEANLVFANLNFQKINRSLENKLLDHFEQSKLLIHDLKNPLGTIQGYADLILDEGSDSPSIQEFSNTIRKSSEKTIRLIDAILLSDGLGNPLNKKTSGMTDVCGIIDLVTAEFASQAKLKSQTIRLDLPAMGIQIMGAESKLEELLGNLLSNAIKYSPAKSSIWIRCHVNAREVIVEVEDQGPGFTKEDRERAFRPGQTLSAKTTAGESSTGYGLFIARQIAEMHKGSLEIGESKSGRGACVSLRLPIRRGPQPSLDL